MSGHIQMGSPRVMVSYRPGLRPSKKVGDKAFLPEGAIFINLPEGVMCVGTGKGGWVEYSLTRLAVVSEDVEPI